MSKGESGRIVIEIDPVLKRRLYSALAMDGCTLKDWFILCAESHLQATGSSGVEEPPAQVNKNEL